MSDLYFTILIFYLQQKESSKQQCFICCCSEDFFHQVKYILRQIFAIRIIYFADSFNVISPSLHSTFKVGAEVPTSFS